MKNNPLIFLKATRRVDFVIAAIAVTVLVVSFMIFAATKQHDDLSDNNSTVAKAQLPPSSTVVNITHEQVARYGQHPCPDSPAVLCIGPYVVNETIITYPDGHNLTLEELPSNPLQYPDH